MSDEKAEKIQEVERISVVNIAEFIQTIRRMDPYGVHDDRCIFCKDPEPSHRGDCKWVLIGGGAQ
jgi:hypothetical protein